MGGGVLKVLDVRHDDRRLAQSGEWTGVYSAETEEGDLWVLAVDQGGRLEDFVELVDGRSVVR